MVSVAIALGAPFLVVGACSLYDGSGVPGDAGGTPDTSVPPDGAFDSSAQDGDAALGPDTADGAPPFTPTDISGMQLWLRADQGVISDGGVIVEWDDISGKADPARNALSAAAAPTMVDAGFGGALYFSSAQAMRTGSWDGGVNAPFTLFIVAGKDAMPGPTRSLCDSLNPAAQTAIVVDNNRLIQYAGAYGTPANGVVTKPMTVLAVFNGASSFILRSSNRGDAGMSNPGNNGFAAGLTIGNYSGGGMGAFEGYIAEFIVYSHALNDPEIVSLNGYASKRYGITIQ